MCSTAGFKAHTNSASFWIMQQNRIWKLYTKWIFIKKKKITSCHWLWRCLQRYFSTSPINELLPWPGMLLQLLCQPAHPSHMHTYTYTPFLGSVFVAVLITSSCKASKTLHIEFKTHLILSLSLQFSQMLVESEFVSRLEQYLGTRFWSQSFLD